MHVRRDAEGGRDDGGVLQVREPTAPASLLSNVALAAHLAAAGGWTVSRHNVRSSRRRTSRRLLPRPIRWRGPVAPPPRLRSARPINALFRGMGGAERYLEVGVWKGFTIESVEAAFRTGVDPAPLFDLERLPPGVQIFPETSDEFFAGLPSEQRYDVIFLDGLHTFEQTQRDLRHALEHLADGAVLVDDTVPLDSVSAMADEGESLQRRTRLGLAGRAWHGDVWKVVVLMARCLPGLELRTILGSGNPQTLVWRRQPDLEVRWPDQAAIDATAELSFDDVFAGGIPELFQPGREADAVAACLGALSPRH